VDVGVRAAARSFDIAGDVNQPAGGSRSLRSRSSQGQRLRTRRVLFGWRMRSGSVEARRPRDSWMSASMTASGKAMRSCSPSIDWWRTPSVVRHHFWFPAMGARISCCSFRHGHHVRCHRVRYDGCGAMWTISHSWTSAIRSARSARRRVASPSARACPAWIAGRVDASPTPPQTVGVPDLASGMICITRTPRMSSR
jgi:hypothetical protein